MKMKHRLALLGLLALGLFGVGATVRIGSIILQRAEWAMLAHRTLYPGELVYLDNGDGTVTLRVGDGQSTYGLQPIDIAAVRVAAQIDLSQHTGFYVETFGGATANADGTYTIGPDAIAATGGLRIVAADARMLLAAVEYDVHQMGWDAMNPPASGVTESPNDLVSVATNSVTLFGFGGGSQYPIVSNIAAKGWIDRTPIGSTNDYRQTTVLIAPAVDAESPTSLRQMQSWLNNNEGRHWSLHPLLSDLQLAGYRLIFNTARTWTMGLDPSDDSLLLAKGGSFVARFYGASTTNAADSIRIVGAALATNVMTLYVATSEPPTRAPVIASCTNLLRDVWQSYDYISNTWTNTVAYGTNAACYRIEVAAPSGSMFFRVFAELPGQTPATVEVRSLVIDGKRLLLNEDNTVTWQ